MLLGVCLAAYFGLDVYADAVGASDLRLRYLDVSLLNENVFAFLGACILFLQFAIILFSMLDRIADTLRIIIRPLALLIPLILYKRDIIDVKPYDFPLDINTINFIGMRLIGRIFSSQPLPNGS